MNLSEREWAIVLGLLGLALLVVGKIIDGHDRPVSRPIQMFGFIAIVGGIIIAHYAPPLDLQSYR